MLGGQSPASAQTQESKPKLVDEFNQVTNGYAKAVIDNFINQFSDDLTSTAYIIFYRGKTSNGQIYNPKTKEYETKCVLPLKVQAAQKLKFYRNYIITNHRFDELRLVLIDGGYKEKESTEFWLVSAGQEPPKPAPTFEEKDVKFRKKGKIRKSDILKDC